MGMVDDITNSVMRRIRASGMLTENLLMGTVTAVGTTGTITVTHGIAIPDHPEIPSISTYNKVRIIGQSRPTVGDSVQIAKAKGGWVCLGSLAPSNAPRIQSGTIATSSGTGTQTATWIFGRPFAGTPNITLTPVTTVPQNLSNIAVTSVSATGFTIRVDRTSSPSTNVAWIATDY